jgi:hypothetical protein
MVRRRPDEHRQRDSIHRLAVMDIDGSPRVAVQAGVESLRWVRQGGTFGKGQLDHGFVGFTCADDARVRPDRDAAPLPLFDNPGVRGADNGTYLGQHGPPPISEFANSLVDQRRR